MYLNAPTLTTFKTSYSINFNIRCDTTRTQKILQNDRYFRSQNKICKFMDAIDMKFISIVFFVLLEGKSGLSRE